MSVTSSYSVREVLIDQPIVFLIDRLRRLPFIRHLRQSFEDQRFARASGCQRLFHGVYESFAQAAAAAPKTKPLHYDDQAFGYQQSHRSVLASDYPVIFWLGRLLASCSTLVDFGGNVGMAYYAYQKYLSYPPHISWLVYDLPEIVAAGRSVRQSEGAPLALSFTDKIADIDGSDVFLAAGSLQYIPDSLPELFGKLQNRPKHLLINKLPICECASFVTLQSTGTGFSPYQVTNRHELLRQLSQLGYSVDDTWQNPDLKLHIPGQPEHSLDSFSGMYCKQVG